MGGWESKPSCSESETTSDEERQEETGEDSTDTRDKEKSLSSSPSSHAVCAETSTTTSMKNIQEAGVNFTKERMVDNQALSVPVKVSSALCRVNTNYTGFLGKFLCETQPCFGLFTTNHVLHEEILSADHLVTITFYDSDRKIRVRLNTTFRFTCSLLDVTFIHFDQQLVDEMIMISRSFLILDSSWIGTDGDQLWVVQSSESCSGLHPNVVAGRFYCFYGCDAFHKPEKDNLLCGSPVVTIDGNVVGIHKGRVHNTAYNCNVAVSSKYLLHAIYCYENLPKQLVCNPSALNKLYEGKVCQQNLERCTEPNLKFLMYISPMTQVGTTLVITPIWFVPTSHGWYWTPTDPFDSDCYSNWMTVHNLKVIGGYWHNIEPANKNIIIINWLRKNVIE